MSSIATPNPASVPAIHPTSSNTVQQPAIISPNKVTNPTEVSSSSSSTKPQQAVPGTPAHRKLLEAICALAKQTVPEDSEESVSDSTLFEFFHKTIQKMGLSILYDLQVVFSVEGVSVYSGRLTLGGIFLARSVGVACRPVKIDAYTQALDELATATLDEIYALEDLGVGTIK
jgi:hypothetical protein